MSDLPLKKYRNKSQQALVSEQDRSNSQVIYEALFELLLSQGYANISLQQLSKLTGISRTTLYRRWSSLDDLIVDAIANKIQDSIEIPQELAPIDAFKIMLQQLAMFLQSPLGHSFLQASLNIKDEISIRKRQDLWHARYQLIAQSFQRLLPENQQQQNIHDIISMTLGSFYFQIFIENKKVDDSFINAVLRNSLTLLQSR
ncbi:TetR/AcrR family transcriptional regulator [Acinetobacter sp. UBA6720]|uniref:TetR/AcrR family transcriptional regulator n=1 Tax=Acinetobacter sp. UBA6720 TaxID=1945953 RepID=UPI0025BADC1D|nr:TetR/AcrR family transcriptional regulator [Acinetobacter sp. UBA6720]